jgi:hypothetical protein
MGNRTLFPGAESKAVLSSIYWQTSRLHAPFPSRPLHGFRA